MEKFIVLDLEWNQSPHGKEGTVEHFPFEIIEIGAVKLNEEFQVVSEFHRLIRPQVYTELHFKISEVVHMNIEELQERGRDFREVIQEFTEWCGEDVTPCTWGSMDLTELQRNISYYGLENPFPKPLLYYDVQKLYSLNFKGGKEKPSLDAAVEECGILAEMEFHRALDDARYTAEVMKYLDWNSMKPYLSIDYYRVPETREEEIYLEFPEYAKFVSKCYDTKEEALDDKIVTDMICCRCRRMLRKKIRWFPVSQKGYLCLAVCPEHGWIKGKIRVKKSEDGRIYFVKTMKFTGESGAAEIMTKKEEAKKRRNEKNKLRRVSHKHKWKK
ncbi:3'-5' exonuclease [Clostridium sp. AM58-1XD]|uniref:3'-5' exonuclease n=1 Tax=Clostridium sp. AM58-1XD TaxID=2292307 RepID=UPI000E526D0D|nr:3'-5' exonuclease [Clostridium sp. AM58-1XD]RGY97388.1 DNA polymerase III [Clostridium sp. AM58-1XD]